MPAGAGKPTLPTTPVPKYRWIGRATSDDFVHWSKVVPMDPGAAPLEHLYTSQTHPYFRAPHIYIAFPRRFLPGLQVLSEDQVRSLVLEEPGNYRGLKLDTSDGVFMTSRGGTRYDRTFMEAFVRPGMDLRNWVSWANTAVLGVVPDRAGGDVALRRAPQGATVALHRAAGAATGRFCLGARLL